MKHILIALVFIFGLTACDTSASMYKPTNLELLDTYELPDGNYWVTLYQHRVSKNCYVRYELYKGSFAQVACEDFLPKQETKEEQFERLKKELGK